MSTVLACTDGSLYAPSIYQHAAWAAGRIDAGVHVLHVIERDEHLAGGDLSGTIGFDANAELLDELAKLDESHARVARLRGKAILDDAGKQLGDKATLTQRHGSVVETVENFEKDAAIVVIGKRGEHADFSKGHLGSNLERVVRSASIPVLVAAREFKAPSRFLIAFDGGSSALKAVHHVATDPLLRGMECHLVAVGKPGGELERSLKAAAAGLQGAGFAVTADLLPGEPEEVIAAELGKRSADLLVMGAYGHSRVRQLILGSTTTSLIRTCQVPVLLFR
ncbi:universal stress protein [Luteolibacter marinus]|uniref:universal stress protein n=1 Tax=Luteolibacter marinus TaxID=2776705 RepID=UPI001869503E|nr:universal stress protein [Luteolibacter marinus]